MLLPTVNIVYWAAAMFLGALASGTIPLIYAFQEVILVYLCLTVKLCHVVTIFLFVSGKVE